ncbi:DUF3159 domain-containing protein [Corynebacterium phocae]|nr:DUF3159 domain-containing protein [Corynebacterium phocae]
MGGVTGLVSATLPVLVLIPVNSQWGMGPALISALLVAAAIMAWRLARKETLQPAVSGLIGVAICAGIAWLTGDAKGYFLYGIWASFVLFVLTTISMLVRWPAVGVVWKGVNGESMIWRQVPKALWSYTFATAGWATIFLARFLVQNHIYNSAEGTTSLGLTRVLMGWPLTGLVMVLTVLMVKRANAAVDEAVAQGKVSLPAETTDAPSSARSVAAQESKGVEQPLDNHHPAAPRSTTAQSTNPQPSTPRSSAPGTTDENPKKDS